MPKRALIAEPDPEEALRQAGILTGEGYEVHLFDSSRTDLLSELAANPPDLLVLRHERPGSQTGIALVSRLKQVAGATAIVITTSDLTPDAIEKSRRQKVHADGYLRSPVERSELVAAARARPQLPKAQPPGGGGEAVLTTEHLTFVETGSSTIQHIDADATGNVDLPLAGALGRECDASRDSIGPAYAHTPVTTPGDPFVGTLFGGRWLVERILTSGGMGSVYVATHTDTSRRVALKVIKSDVVSNEDFVARFRRETSALAAISHPNVVTFLDSGIENGNFYLVMELLAGRSLRNAMDAPMPWRNAVYICADVCRALAAVHKLGIIHRDLKPENVFLQDSEGHEQFAKLIDFGIVRLRDRQTAMPTQIGAIIGTPGYISPEQLQGKAATAASDLYAVGVILYELVVGRFPFEAPSVNAMLVRQLIEPLVPPRELAPTLPAHVEDLILHLMDKDAEKRVATAKDALALLLNALMTTEDLAPVARTEADSALGRFVGEALPRPTAATPHGLGITVPEERESRALLAGSAALVVVFLAVTTIVLRFLEASPFTHHDPTPSAVPADLATAATVSPVPPSAPLPVAVVVPTTTTTGTQPTQERHASGGKRKPATPKREPPSMAAVAIYVRYHASELASCGGYRTPKQMQFSLHANGNFTLDENGGDPELTCAREQVGRWRGDAFDGAPVHVVVPASLGTRKLPSLNAEGKLPPLETPNP